MAATRRAETKSLLIAAACKDTGFSRCGAYLGLRVSRFMITGFVVSGFVVSSS